MNYKLIPLAVTAAVCFASCANDEEMDRNLNTRGDAISFSPKVGHTTRATETTKTNLGNFFVFGKSVYSDGTLYDAYLIGAGDTPEVASRNADGTACTLNHDVYLPSGIKNAVFWAFTDHQSTTASTENNPLSSGTVTFDTNKGPQISGYTANKADLSADGTVWADGSDQKDLVTAFGQARGTDGAISNIIDLTFNHMLSQITVKAGQKGKGENDHRVVKVKGMWLVNAYQKGDLSAGYEFDNTDGNTANQATDKPKWTQTANSKTTFGTYFKTAMDLSTHTDAEDFVDLTNSSLMLVPQTVESWNPASASVYSNTPDAYIMLLCRVELKHEGSKHGDNPAAGDDIHIEGDYHYHQQFPHNAEGKWDDAQYGLTCIPVKFDWTRGKHYVYNLDICGAASGAGIYPPKYTEDEIKGLIPDGEEPGIKVVPIPNDKEPGDPVLDDPIKFNVDVTSWEDENNWTPGNATAK